MDGGAKWALSVRECYFDTSAAQGVVCARVSVLEGTLVQCVVIGLLSFINHILVVFCA